MAFRVQEFHEGGASNLVDRQAQRVAVQMEDEYLGEIHRRVIVEGREFIDIGRAVGLKVGLVVVLDHVERAVSGKQAEIIIKGYRAGAVFGPCAVELIKGKLGLVPVPGGRHISLFQKVVLHSVPVDAVKHHAPGTVKGICLPVDHLDAVCGGTVAVVIVPFPVNGGPARSRSVGGEGESERHGGRREGDGNNRSFHLLISFLRVGGASAGTLPAP